MRALSNLFVWMCALLIANMSATYAASFSCAGSLDDDERAVFADQVLSRLDDDMAVAYAQALQKVSDREQLRDDQRSFLSRRKQCVADAGCIKNAYTRQLQALRRIANSSLGQIYPDKPQQAPVARPASYEELVRQWNDDKVIKSDTTPSAPFHLETSIGFLDECNLYLHYINDMRWGESRNGISPGRMKTSDTRIFLRKISSLELITSENEAAVKFNCPSQKCFDKDQTTYYWEYDQPIRSEGDKGWVDINTPSMTTKARNVVDQFELLKKIAQTCVGR